ncbi:MAG: tetratricopeptide repeat protein [Spirochaetota bacterium]|jgi:tetratricopeptide (TPR) repeat protein|nr:tetratricopeptide repeat protein [Spirochaetota bacterium]
MNRRQGEIVPGKDDKFAGLDQLFESLGRESERGAPDLGTPMAPGEGNFGPDAASPFSDLNSFTPAEEKPAVETISKEEAALEEMLRELDSPKSDDSRSNESSAGADFLDLSAPPPAGSGFSFDDELNDEPDPAPPVMSDEPSMDDFAPDEPPVEETPLAEEMVAPDTSPWGDLEAEIPADAADDAGADFVQELENVDLDIPGSFDEAMADGFETDFSDQADAVADEGMSSFIDELASADLPAEEAPAADDSLDLGSAFSEGAAAGGSDDPFSGFSSGFSSDETSPGIEEREEQPAGLSEEDDNPFGDLGGFGSDFQSESSEAAFPGLDEGFTTDYSSGDNFDNVDLGFGSGVAVPSGGDEDYVEPIELSDEDLRRIRKRMTIMTPRLREAATRAISGDAIKPKAQNRLILMLLNKASMNEVRAFLEQELGESLREEAEIPGMEAFPEAAASPSRRTPYPSIPRESAFGKIWPILRLSVLAVGVVVLCLLLYLLLIRPGMTGRDLMERGLASIRLEDYTEGEDFFRRGEVYLGKDIAWYRRYAETYNEMREPARAIRKIREGLAFAPRDFDSLMLLGDIHTETKDFDSARETFLQMEKYYPESLKVPEKIGDVYLAMGDDRKSPDYYELARIEYEKITDKDWKNLDGQFKTLLAYVKMRKLPQAEEKLRHIHRINSSAMHVPILTEYSALLQDNQKWSESRTMLESILDKDWQYAPAQYRMSKYYREQLDYKRALAHINNAVRYDKNSAVFHNERGEVLLSFMRPDIPEAMQSFTLARELDPKYPPPYINLGHIYYEHLTPGDSGDLNLEERNYDQALENYENALYLMPADFNDEKFFYNLGWLYYRKKRYEDALVSWQRLYAENPFHPVISFSMGNAWLHLGKDDLAEAEYDKVMRYYETIAKRISFIDPDQKRHKNVFGMLVNSYNNLGVAWEKRHQRLGDPEWEKRALMSFWKSRELADRLNKVGFEFPENNIRYVLHRDYRNRELAIAPELGNNTVPKFLAYEKQ